MIKTIQLILHSWYLDTIDFIEFIGEHIYQFLYCHQWNERLTEKEIKDE